MEVEGPPNSHSKLDINLIRHKYLFKSAENRDVSLLNTFSEEQLLKELSLHNEDGRSPLHVAVSFGHSKVVKLLSASDPSVSGINNVDEEGWGPLHSSASSGNAEIVENFAGQRS